MAKSKGPRKKYSGGDSSKWAERALATLPPKELPERSAKDTDTMNRLHASRPKLAAATDKASAKVRTSAERVLNPPKQAAPKPKAKPPSKPQARPKPKVAAPIPASARTGVPRGVKIAGGALLGTAAAGGAYALYRHRKNQQKEPAVKSLINPFEEVVVFGKAYPVALPVASSQRLSALVPTGGHVGHASDLVRVTGPGAHPRRQELQRFTAKPKGLRQGPFGKALLPTGQTDPAKQGANAATTPNASPVPTNPKVKPPVVPKPPLPVANSNSLLPTPTVPSKPTVTKAAPWGANMTGGEKLLTRAISGKDTGSIVATRAGRQARGEQRGLKMIQEGTYKPRGGASPNSKIPSGPSRGSRIA